MTDRYVKTTETVPDVLTEYLCETSQNFITYFNSELTYVKADIDNLSEKAMNILSEINKEAENSRNTANESISKTYLETSEEMAKDLKKVQNDVESIMSEAMGESFQHTHDPDHEKTDCNEDQSLRRQSGLWSKHLESLSTLEGLVCTPMFSAITSLSHDDIVMHYINNAISVLEEIKVTYFSDPLENGQNLDNNYTTNQIAQDLQRFYSLYSMVSEREIFEKFWIDKKIRFRAPKKSA